MRALWVYRLNWRPTLWDDMTQHEEMVIDEHDRYVDRLHKSGVVILAGAATQPPRGMVFFTADDEDAARAVMLADPCSESGIVDVTLSPFMAGYVGQGRIQPPRHRSPIVRESTPTY